MRNLKEKLKAMWMIAKADGFDVAVTYPTKIGYFIWTTSVFGTDESSNIIHNDIGNTFAYWCRAVEECNKTKREW